MSDTRSTLLLRLRDPGDQTAWRMFDQLYRPLIVGYARSRSLDANDADDVAQQCVQAVLTQISTYEHLGSFKSWLRAIAENKIRDHFRHKKRERQADTSLLLGLPDVDANPEQLWERHWWQAHLRYCAESIRQEVAPSTYSAFVQYAIEGLPADQVAKHLGLSANQVYVAKHRVLERIRDILADLTGPDALEAG